MYNIVFLDIDGVMLSGNDIKAIYEKTHTCVPSRSPFGSVAMKCLKELVEEFDARIVISSTWRMSKEDMEYLKEQLQLINIADRLIGVTPVKYERRDAEIKEWLDNNKNLVKSFVILDDDGFDLTEYRYNLVNSQFDNGFTKKDLEHAKSILNRTEDCIIQVPTVAMRERFEVSYENACGELKRFFEAYLKCSECDKALEMYNVEKSYMYNTFMYQCPVCGRVYYCKEKFPYRLCSVKEEAENGSN